MKTTFKTLIIVALAAGLATTVSAAPPGKHAIEKIPHRHGAQGATHTEVNHTMLKRTGPPGKGFVRSASNNRR